MFIQDQAIGNFSPSAFNAWAVSDYVKGRLL